MEYLVYVPLFILGLIIGSFLNVVILRWNTGARIASGRSKCFSCDKPLAWYELVPVFSFIFQGGKCRECGSRISWQYPMVELATAIVITSAFISLSDAYFFLLAAVIFCLYVVIFVYDLKHKIIPDAFSYAAALFALGFIARESYLTGSIDPLHVIAGPALFLFFYTLWYASKGRWMGLGDAKLALSVGWLLGLSHGIAAILLSFWIGAMAAIIIIIFQKLFRRKALTLKSEIPFGPFILIGTAISFFWNVDMRSILAALAL